jgi:hypothetical protein
LTSSVPAGALTWRLGDQEEGTLHVEKSVLKERESGDVRYAKQTLGWGIRRLNVHPVGKDWKMRCHC